MTNQNTKRDEKMKKVTIQKADGNVGQFDLTSDGTWNITLNGKAAPSNYYYTTDQVKKVIEDAKQSGETVTVE